jgi:hypothetical protein
VGLLFVLVAGKYSPHLDTNRTTTVAGGLHQAGHSVTVASGCDQHPCTTKPQPCSKAAVHTFCLSVDKPGQCDRPPVTHCPPCPPPAPPPPPADGESNAAAASEFYYTTEQQQRRQLQQGCGCVSCPCPSGAGKTPYKCTTYSKSAVLAAIEASVRKNTGVCFAPVSDEKRSHAKTGLGQR